MGRLVPALVLSPKESLFFSDSSFAVLRHGPLTVFIDGDEREVRHHHRGKPNILLYFGPHEVLVDSGCCNYDRAQARNSYAAAQAHNVVLVEPVAEAFGAGHEAKGDVKLFNFVRRSDLKSMSMSRRARRGGFHYSWRRKIILMENHLEIEDQVQSSARARCVLLFHFPSSSRITFGRDDQAHVVTPYWALAMTQNVSAAHTRTCLEAPALDELNQQSFCHEFRCCAEGEKVTYQTTFDFQ